MARKKNAGEGEEREDEDEGAGRLGSGRYGTMRIEGRQLERTCSH